MYKDSFDYPQASYVLDRKSKMRTFNVSGTYFEYLIYIKPDTYTSGSYRMDAYLEQGY